VEVDPRGFDTPPLTWGNSLLGVWACVGRIPLPRYAVERSCPANYATLMSDLKDDDHTSFLGAGDDGPVLSRAAFQLHTAGLVNAHRDGHPGFVSDEYLGTISDEKRATATELCLAGLWERAEGVTGSTTRRRWRASARCIYVRPDSKMSAWRAADSGVPSSKMSSRRSTVMPTDS
jgi:hypothetical protein